MALPILETPTYELTLPSTNKKIVYRPFLVKEYKVLLTLLESDAKEISRVVNSLVDNCTFNKLDMQKLAHFDIEYLFLNIRAKSISETADIVITCDCGNKIDHTIDITSATIENASQKIDNKIMISDNIGVVMRYPRFEEMLDLYDKTNRDNVIKLVTDCVDAVFTKEDYHDKESFSEDEITEFVNKFTKEQFDKLEKFFDKLPKVVQHIEATCGACGKLNVIDVEGLQNFFV